ncbi:MAG: helix-turn-helix domain-containing protein [Sphingobacteriales bacterium]|nr:MAG: helix-turn-helix domain-containing protein [Sphingobacteriales bacterium]
MFAMNDISFEQLPKAVNQIFDKLVSIEQLLLNKSSQSSIETEELLTVQDAATFLSLSVPTIYGLISKGELPVMKRWWAYMADIMESNADQSPVSIPLDEVFYLP